MFERFTDPARHAVVAAQREARRLSHGEIDTGHLLLGLMDPRSGAAHTVLSELGVDIDHVRYVVRAERPIVGGGPGHMPFTDEGKQALEAALRQALSLGDSHVGTAHMLIGVVLAGRGSADAALAQVGVAPETVQRAALDVLRSAHGKEDQLAGADDSPNPWTGSTELEPHRTPPSEGAVVSGPLAEFGTDLTAIAEAGSLDPVVGRDSEVRRVIQVLARKTKNNPVLLGDPGVGKTAVAEALAQRIAAGDVPSVVEGMRVIALDLGAMVAGSRYRGDFEKRIKSVLEAVAERDDLVLFLDEIHTVVGAGSAEGAVDASNLLKPALARGGLRLIGATTVDEYRRHMEKDAALARRFQTINVEEPDLADARQIAEGLRDTYQAHHRVTIDDAALDAAVQLTARYVADRYLPDKALDAVDEACSRRRIEFEEAGGDPETTPAVTRDDVAAVVADWTGIPTTRVTAAESELLRGLEDKLHGRMVGQDEAVSAVARAIRRNRAGLRDPGRPVGSFLFLGPTGVGKTELARTLADELYGGPNSLVRIDLSEYMEKHTVARLVGSPPGYVGYEQSGQLTGAVRRRPHSVVLFDEVEKAHPDVLNVLLQVLDDGHLTDARGRRVDFSNTIIVMTSNLGSKDLGSANVGFVGNGETIGQQLERQVSEEVARFFRPEFLNRVDEQVVFHPLSREDIEQIVHRMVARLERPLADRGITLHLDHSAVELLAETGYDPLRGARPLRRAVQRHLEDALADQVLNDKPAGTGSVVITAAAVDGELVLTTQPQREDETREAVTTD